MASNLNPKTAAFNTAGVLLGAEQYPSLVQQAVAGNTGFALYAPRSLVANPTVLVGDGTWSSYAMLAAGKYDMYGYLTAQGVTGTHTIAIEGTYIVENPGGGTMPGTVYVGTLAAYAVTEASWHHVTVTCAGEFGSISTFGVIARQYE